MATLNMDRIVNLCRESGVAAHVEQTGGGVATIYAGEADDAGRFPVAAGPGTFGWGRGSLADDADFCIAPDNDGSAPASAYHSCEGMSEQAIADEIIRRCAVSP